MRRCANCLTMHISVVALSHAYRNYNVNSAHQTPVHACTKQQTVAYMLCIAAGEGGLSNLVSDWTAPIVTSAPPSPIQTIPPAPGEAPGSFDYEDLYPALFPSPATASPGGISSNPSSPPPVAAPGATVPFVTVIRSAGGSGSGSDVVGGSAGRNGGAPGLSTLTVAAIAASALALALAAAGAKSLDFSVT